MELQTAADAHTFVQKIAEASGKPYRISESIADDIVTVVARIKEGREPGRILAQTTYPTPFLPSPGAPNS